jgi:seryl-tRNA synthetase
MPDEDVLPGGKENNKVVREWGKKPEFNFKPKDHMELVKLNDLIDYERGVKLGGNGFWIYKGNGAILEWALLNYFIEEHIKDGYQFMLPPHILNYQCGLTAGQFPKFADEVYIVKGEEDNYSFMLPTSETALINLHRDEILKEEDLPRKYFSYTPCYRVEAGSHRASERGMIRGHQFNKVEMFQYTKPEDSDAALEELIGKAERLVQGLGLHYRVTKLAAKDASASMAKTYDIEIWIPSMNDYKEVSSASNARDYQARRGMIRFKREGSKKTEYVNTLNASGLATSRLFPAIMEQYQQEDGSIIVPEVLRKWVGRDRL